MSTLILLVSFFGCGQKKADDNSGKVIYDTVPATNITITPEYFFVGDFTYMADAAVLKEWATGTNLPVAMMEVYPEAEKQYKALKTVDGEAVRAEFRGYLKSKGKDEEGAARQLVITQVVNMQKANGGVDVAPVIGEYVTPEQSLILNSDHTYTLNAKDGETEKGDWFLSTEEIVVFASKDGHTVMNLDPNKKSLSTRDEVPVMFKKK